MAGRPASYQRSVANRRRQAQRAGAAWTRHRNRYGTDRTRPCALQYDEAGSTRRCGADAVSRAGLEVQPQPALSGFLACSYRQHEEYRMSSRKTLRPLYVQVHPQDTVAILVNEGGLPAGTQFDSGLTLLEDVPEAHKVALVDIDAGAPIVRYGSVIGYAKAAIAKGSWVHEERMRMPVAPSLENLPLATAVPPPMPALEGYTFEGFLNDDGTVG